MKNKYLSFIKKFSTINVSKICKQLNINRSNILNGNASEETTKILYNEINKQLLELLRGNNGTNNNI